MASLANVMAYQAKFLATNNEKKEDKKEDKKKKDTPNKEPSKRKYYFRGKYNYPPEGYVPPAGTLRVHSPEERTPRGTRRILQDWSLCVKPRTEPSGGCRNGYFGYFVESGGVIRKAVWVGGEVCDWEGDEEGEDGEENGDDDGGEMEEGMAEDEIEIAG